MIIGLCGAPGAGKSECQKLLSELGVIAIDDKLLLRRFSRRKHGLSNDDVLTQAGKSKVVWVDGKPKTIREIMGDDGFLIEAARGPNYLLERELKKVAFQAPEAHFSFGSIRHGQGWVVRERGGIVIEVVRPGVSSNLLCDEYESGPISARIENSGCLSQLRREVIRNVTPFILAETPQNTSVCSRSPRI